MEEDVRSKDAQGDVGVIAYALLAVMAAVLGLSAAVILNQIAGAKRGAAGTVPAAEEALFEPPQPAITAQRQVLTLTPDAPRWLANARPFPLAPDQPALAVVVIEPDENRHLLDRVMARERNLTIAVAHDFSTTRWRVQNIRREGHEILTLLPTAYGDDFARHANVIRRGLGPQELRRRVSWHLAATAASVGAMDLGGGEVLRDAEAMAVAAAALSEAGALFVDARSHRESLAAPLIRAAGVPATQRTVRVRAQDDAAQIISRLEEAESHALRWNHALVVVEASPATLDALSYWLDARNRDISLAPVSAIVARLRSGSR